MDEPIGCLVADVGVDRATPEAAGLSTGQVQGVTRQFIVYAREKVGEDELGGSSAPYPVSRNLFEYQLV